MQLRMVSQVVVLATLCIAALGTSAPAQVQAPTVTVAGVGYVNYAYQLRTDSSITPVGHGKSEGVEV